MEELAASTMYNLEEAMENLTMESPGSTLADRIQEIGYEFCSSVGECIQHFANLGVTALDNAEIADILIMMIRTHTGLHADRMPPKESDEGLSDGVEKLDGKGATKRDVTYEDTSFELYEWVREGDEVFDINAIEEDAKRDETSLESYERATVGEYWNATAKGFATDTAWDMRVFVEAVFQISPKTVSWHAILEHLDHPDFRIVDKKGLGLILKAFTLGFVCHKYIGPYFPVDKLFRTWKHAEAQFSFLEHIVRNPDIFNFLFHDLLRFATSCYPIKEHIDVKFRMIGRWCSLGPVIETILKLAERGLMTQAMELLREPRELCPDFLALGLMAAPYSELRQELLGSLMQPLLNFRPNGENAKKVLRRLYQNSPDASIPKLVVESMMSYVVVSDNDLHRLSRVLEVGSQVRSLDKMLNDEFYPFSLDLACLAHRREYLNLHLWLRRMIESRQERFIAALVDFLQQRCPELIGGFLTTDSVKQAYITDEAVTTIMVSIYEYKKFQSPVLAYVVGIMQITWCEILTHRIPPRKIHPAGSIPSPKYWELRALSAQFLFSTPPPSFKI